MPPRPTNSSEPGSKYKRTNEKDLRARLLQDPANHLLQQQLLDELSKQQRLAQELVDLQGPEPAISVFGRTDLEIAEEIKRLKISLIIDQDAPEQEEKKKEPVAVFTHSESYDNITFNGESCTLPGRQGAVVKLLHEALQKGHPVVSARKIISLHGCLVG